MAALTADEVDSAPSAAVESSYVLDMGKLGIRVVRDVAFLHGYSEPVALVLHETAPAWTGSLSHRKDTCAVTAISIGLKKGRPHPVLWSCKALPHDCLRVIAAPEPLNGALILTQDLVMYRSQTQHSATAPCLPGVAVNPRLFAGTMRPMPRPATQAQGRSSFPLPFMQAMQADPYTPLTREASGHPHGHT